MVPKQSTVVRDRITIQWKHVVCFLPVAIPIPIYSMTTSSPGNGETSPSRDEQTTTERDDNDTSSRQDELTTAEPDDDGSNSTSTTDGISGGGDTGATPAADSTVTSGGQESTTDGEPPNTLPMLCCTICSAGTWDGPNKLHSNR